MTLEASGLEVTPDEIRGLFEPFVAQTLAADDPTWRAEIRRRKRKLLRQAVERVLGRQRDKARVVEEYDRAWERIDYGMYALGRELRFVTPWVWRGRQMLASDAGATRVRQLLLCRAIERLKPRRVLEVGCGNGINLILLAGRFPEIAFTGVDLTEAGVRASQELQKRPALPDAMRAFAPLEVVDPTAFRRIAFHRGDAASLPFADASFDLVCTVLALEQMEQVRERALAEIARTSAGHTLMIEPFADVNADFWPRLNVFRRNYFRGSIAGLRAHGLEPELATADFPQEVFLKACLVLARKAAP
ncbi:MAG TPA: class I SAM-dependent methyltransferase [Geminicoccaceae bacterium]|nr:class I SAM-dependent methyltransferase [Geminicoccaceae bacterium]